MVFFGLEKLSLVDFDGYVASTVFTGGCNFKCGFCHNSSLVLNYSSLSTISEEEVLGFLKKRKGIIEGVCITGGEPTLQRDLPDFCAKIKALNLKVKVDTNGTNPQMVKGLVEDNLVDYFAMDIKNSLDDYASIIGFTEFDTTKIQQTVEYFLQNNVDYEFRTTLIKEFHTKNNIEQIGIWLKGAKKYVLQKFKDSKDCIQSHLSAVENEVAHTYIEILKKNIKNVALRGYDN